jgi:integrase
MATNVYIVKRATTKKRRNGKATYKYALRWKDSASGKWQCESSGTADKTEAESLRKLKWAEVNGIIAPQSEPEQEPAPHALLPTWDECREAFEKAMKADNLRPSYIASSREAFNVLQRTIPGLPSPALLTEAQANEYKRSRAGAGISPWSIRSDLACLKALFGKWLGRECGLLSTNPFANVRPPKCDDPDVRIVSATEATELANWFSERWNGWRLPVLFLEVATQVGWRATELASLRAEDLLDDGIVQCVAQSSKTRKQKFGQLSPALHTELRERCAGGWVWGRFSDELRRLLILWKRQPNHAASVRDFSPARLVAWLQDELKRYNAVQAAKAAEVKREWQTITLHDLRRTAITWMQMSGMSEKETGMIVGATPGVIRKHYDKLDQLAIAKRSMERRQGQADAPIFARPLRAGDSCSLDGAPESSQTLTA